MGEDPKPGTTKNVAVDLHGGDHGPKVLVPAAIDALRADQALTATLVGLPEAMETARWQLEQHGLVSRVSFHPCEHVLDTEASPGGVLRNGSGSSLWNTIELVSSGRAQAAVSAASTSALMLLGVRLLKRLPGVLRPALMSSIPLRNGTVDLLDLGANLQVDATQLVQFAMMGSVVSKSGNDGEAPSIGLLNVGHEDSKGHAIVRQAHELMSDTGLNYYGFIEGHNLFEGVVDVAVCDGFAGNLILKASEGLASMLFTELRSSLAGHWRGRVGGYLAKPMLKGMLDRLDPAKHNGAPLLGLNGVLIKSHGRSEQRASCAAILEAGREIERQVPQRIAQMISTF